MTHNMEEEVYGESLDSSGSSSSSRITEEDLIDTFFHSCDLHNEGVVPASRIIEHLHFTVRDTVAGDEKIQQLQHLLDPLSVDVYVDIHTYRSVVTQWIENIRDNEADTQWEFQERESPGTLIADHRNRIVSEENENPLSPTLIVDGSPNLFSSIDNMGHDLDFRNRDTGELNNMVASLQYQNHKLMEEITTLRHQLETSEEVSANMLQGVENLRRKTKLYQNMCEKNRDLVRDNEELKLNVVQLDETKRNLQSQIKTLSRDGQQLEGQLQDLHQQLGKSAVDLDIAKKDYDSLNSAYLEQKQLYLKTQVELEDTQIQLKEKSTQMDELEENMGELRKIYEQMKLDKADLEMQLEQNNREINIPQATAMEPSYDGDRTEGSEMDLLFHVSLEATDIAPSLQSELAVSLCDSMRSLPAPVCDKELEDMMAQMNSCPDQDSSKLGRDEIELIQQSLLAARALSDRMGKMITRFYEMQESVLAVVRKGENKCVSSVASSTEDFVMRSPNNYEGNLKKLNLEMENFSHEIVDIAIAKQEADLSISMLAHVLGSTVDANHLNADYFTNFGDLLQVGSKLVPLLENIQEVIGQVRAEALFKSELHLKLEDAEQKVREIAKEARVQSCLIVKLHEGKEILENAVLELKSSTTDLKEELKKSDDEMSCLKHEVVACHEQIDQDKEHLINLQDELTQTQLDHQVDLSELWRLVQKDVENECMSDSQDLSATASTESIREQVAKEIYSLRTRLAKSQAALAALNTTLPVKDGEEDVVHDWKCCKKKSRKPSSPLVEALTLDFAADDGEAGDVERESFLKQNSSADSVLDGREYACDDNGNLHGSSKYFTVSCPHLSRPGASPALQAERRKQAQIGANKNVANTSGSTASGMAHQDVDSYKSESQGTHKSVLMVEEEDDPLLRHRTPSFKRAIERGSSAESTTSIEVRDYMSTSPDLSPERTEPPPYPYRGRDALKGPSHDSLHPDIGSIAFMQDLSHPDADCSVTAILKTSTPNASSADDNDDVLALDPQQLTELKLSPHCGRRLSTLVEEGSDTEVDDHHHRSSKSHLSTTYEMSFPAGPPPPYRPRTPPNYRLPPAYQHAVNRDGIRPSGELPPPPPYQRPVPPPKPQVQNQNSHDGSFTKPKATVNTFTRPHYSTSPVQRVDVRGTARNFEANHIAQNRPQLIQNNQNVIVQGQDESWNTNRQTVFQTNNNNESFSKIESYSVMEQPKAQPERRTVSNRPVPVPDGHKVVNNGNRLKTSDGPEPIGNSINSPAELANLRDSNIADIKSHKISQHEHATDTIVSQSIQFSGEHQDFPFSDNQPMLIPSSKSSVGERKVSQESMNGNPMRKSSTHTPPVTTDSSQSVNTAGGITHANDDVGPANQPADVPDEYVKLRRLPREPQNDKRPSDVKPQVVCNDPVIPPPENMDGNFNEMPGPRKISQPVIPEKKNDDTDKMPDPSKIAEPRKVSQPQVEQMIVTHESQDVANIKQEKKDSTNVAEKKLSDNLTQNTPKHKLSAEENQAVKVLKVSFDDDGQNKVPSAQPGVSQHDVPMVTQQDFSHCKNPIANTILRRFSQTIQPELGNTDQSVSQNNTTSDVGLPNGTEVPSAVASSTEMHPSGNLAELVNGDLGEVELSEADCQLNAQLLEEAKKASAASARRKSRTKRNQSSDLAVSQNTEDECSAITKETNKNDQSTDQSSQAAGALACRKSSQAISPAAKDQPQENGDPKVSTEMPGKTESSKQETDSEAKPSSSGCCGYKAMPQSQVAFPSLPDDTLTSLGLLVSKGDDLEITENLSELELEEKFASLSLAFRTDRLTLEKRIDLNERARDNAENNINKELVGLKDSLKALRTFCADASSRDIYSKIEQHVNVLEQCSTRVSSRAECHGAVQQELRLSKAVEVMMQHVDNLKMLYDKEHQELEETKKLLQENKAQQEGEPTPGKRYSVAGLQGKRLSLSLSGPSMLGSFQQSGKRRASVAAFPRRLSILGGIPNSPRPDPDQPMSNMEPKPSTSEDENAKAKFKSLVVDTALKSTVAGAFRRASLERQLSRESSTNSDVFLPDLSEPVKDHLEVPKINQPNGSASDISNPDEEVIFQKGFEEGIRAQVAEELEALREQQADFSGTLDALIEENDEPDSEYLAASLKKSSILSEDTRARLKEIWEQMEITQLHVRYAMAVLVLVVGLASVLLSLIPSSEASNKPMFEIYWNDIEALIHSYLEVTKYGPVPY